jgi:glycosyltransferase involved in cell wall biosynthesis
MARNAMRSARRILVLEPFFGGSHRAFVEGLERHSAHRFDRLTLPPALWKWRLRAAALALAERARRRPRPDLLLASSLCDAAHLRALLGDDPPPLAVYFHESQLGYPVPEGKGADVHLAIANLASALAARRVLFNSAFHRDDFLGRVPDLLRTLPPPRPRRAAAEIRRRSVVLHPGVDLPPRPAERRPDGPPIILWNHRWEFDKDPAGFFQVCDRLRDRGLPFRLVLLGESQQFVPKPFLAAKERLGAQILHYGFVRRRSQYLAWLARADLIISTALQENFGIAVVEAIAAGCYPLLPNALAYPEILPDRLHPRHLYRDLPDLVERCAALLHAPEGLAEGRAERRRAVERFAWHRVARRYDRLFSGLMRAAAGGPRRPARRASRWVG